MNLAQHNLPTMAMNVALHAPSDPKRNTRSRVRRTKHSGQETEFLIPVPAEIAICGARSTILHVSHPIWLVGYDGTGRVPRTGVVWYFLFAANLGLPVESELA